MSCSGSDFLLSGRLGHFYRSACHHCRHRQDCPYSCEHAFERALRHAAAQGKTAAQLLTAETEQLRGNISCAGSIHSLLEADRAAERALSDLLQAELALAGAIRMLPWMSCYSEEKQEIITRPSQTNRHRSEPNSGCNI